MKCIYFLLILNLIHTKKSLSYARVRNCPCTNRAVATPIRIIIFFVSNNTVVNVKTVVRKKCRLWIQPRQIKAYHGGPRVSLGPLESPSHRTKIESRLFNVRRLFRVKSRAPKRWIISDLNPNQTQQKTTR